MAEQPITVTVEGIAATLEKLTSAARDLERYRSLYAAGPAAEGYSAGFRGSLDFALSQFGTSIIAFQKELRELRDAVKLTGEEMIDLDTDYAHLHSDLSGQLSAATRPYTPPQNAV